MKKEELIRIFVQDNYNFLKDSKTFDRHLYKELKKAYFGQKLKYSIGIPRDKEICSILIDFIIKAQEKTWVSGLHS